MKTLLWNLYQFLGNLSGKTSDWQMSVIRKLDKLDPHYAGRKWAQKTEEGFW